MVGELGSIIARLGADLTDLKRGLLEGKAELSGLRNFTEQTAGQIKKLLAFGGISLGFYELISQAREFGRSILEEGGKVEVLKSASYALASYYQMSGSTVDFYLAKIKEKNIEESRALDAVNKFLRAGVSLEKLPSLAAAAKDLGRTMAMPANEAFSSIIDGIVKGTPKQLALLAPGIREALQGMTSETKKVLDSTIISGAEKSQILTELVLAAWEKAKGVGDATTASYVAKLAEYKLKVLEAKEALFEFLKPVTLAALGQQITSWHELNIWIVNNREQLNKLAAIMAVYIQNGVLSIKATIDFASAHKDLLVVLLELWGVLKVLRWFTIAEGAATATVAVGGLMGKLAALRLGLAGPWGLAIAVTLVGLYAAYKQVEELSKYHPEYVGGAEWVPSEEYKAQGIAVGRKEKYKSSPAGMPSPFGGFYKQKPEKSPAEAQAEADAAAEEEKKRQKAGLPGAGKGGKGKSGPEEDLFGEYLKLLDAKRQAEIQEAQSSLDLLKATNEQKKAELEKNLAAGLMDGRTYYARLQELQQGETAAALALIEQKRQVQAQAHQDALADIARQEQSPEMAAFKRQQEEARNRTVSAQLNAEAARTKLEGEVKVTNELKRQVEVARDYRQKTADLKLESAWGPVEEQEAKLRKLYQDWQRAKEEAINKGAYSPEFAAALDVKLQADLGKAKYGDLINRAADSITQGMNGLVDAVLDGGKDFKTSVNTFFKGLLKEGFKPGLEYLANTLKQLITNLFRYLGGSGGGGGGGDLLSGGLGFFSGLAGLFGGGGGGGGSLIGVSNAYSGYSAGFAAMIPGLAGGALVTAPTLAMVGEAGPEIISPVDKLAGLLGGDEVHNRFDIHIHAIDAPSFNNFWDHHEDKIFNLFENAAKTYRSIRRQR